MTLLDAGMRTTRVVTMLITFGQGASSLAMASPASDPFSAADSIDWASPASSQPEEASIAEAIRELTYVQTLLPKLEDRLDDDAVRAYVRELGRILDAAEGDADHLAHQAGGLAMRLCSARNRLTSSTRSSAVWLSVAKTLSPEGGPFRIPTRLIRRSAAPSTAISIAEIDDVLLAQDALVMDA